MQSRPDAGFGPLRQAAPAGHARAEAQLLRQVFPRDPGMQHEQDALEHQPIRMPLPPRMTNPTLHPRQQRLDHRPKLIVHFPRLPPNHPTPPDQHSGGHPTSPKIISLGVVRGPSGAQRRWTGWPYPGEQQSHLLVAGCPNVAASPSSRPGSPTTSTMPTPQPFPRASPVPSAPGRAHLRPCAFSVRARGWTSCPCSSPPRCVASRCSWKPSLCARYAIRCRPRWHRVSSAG